MNESGQLGAHVAIWRRAGDFLRSVGAQRRWVSLVGDFNSWDGRLDMMRMLGNSGVWEILSPICRRDAIQFEIRTKAGN